jgi:hypothetical protein
MYKLILTLGNLSIDIPVKQLIYTHQKSLETLDILRCIN